MASVISFIIINQSFNAVNYLNQMLIAIADLPTQIIVVEYFELQFLIGFDHQRPVGIAEIIDFLILGLDIAAMPITTVITPIAILVFIVLFQY